MLCPSEDSADEFYKDTVFWSGLLDIEPPALIYSEGSPDRLKSLTGLYPHKDQSAMPLSGNIDRKKFIASVDASLSPLWPKEALPMVALTKGLSYERDFFAFAVEELGYLSVPVVSGAGEVSMRGGIFDIFPPDRDDPVRIEFFGDEIESIRSFEIDTQLSIKEIDDIRLGPAIGPEGGPHLIEFLSGSRLILNEPDDIRRRYPEQERMFLDKEFLIPTCLSSIASASVSVSPAVAIEAIPASLLDGLKERATISFLFNAAICSGSPAKTLFTLACAEIIVLKKSAGPRNK